MRNDNASMVVAHSCFPARWVRIGVRLLCVPCSEFEMVLVTLADWCEVVLSFTLGNV